MSTVVVTVVLFNSADQVEACIDALAPDLDSGIAELVAVDNASPDDSAQLVSRLRPDAAIVSSPDNKGFAGGVNLAWPLVDARYWLLLNPDALVERDTLTHLVRFMDANPDVGAASPWLSDPSSGEVLYPGRAFPSAGRTLLELTRLHRLLPAAKRGQVLQGAYVKRGTPRSHDPDWVPGTALVVRTDAVRAVGVLDESFFLYGEDLEWCW